MAFWDRDNDGTIWPRWGLLLLGSSCSGAALPTGGSCWAPACLLLSHHNSPPLLSFSPTRSDTYVGFRRLGFNVAISALAVRLSRAHF